MTRRRVIGLGVAGVAAVAAATAVAARPDPVPAPTADEVVAAFASAGISCSPPVARLEAKVSTCTAEPDEAGPSELAVFDDPARAVTAVDMVTLAACGTASAPGVLAGDGWMFVSPTSDDALAALEALDGRITAAQIDC